MSTTSSAQDKTEKATPKRKSEARKKGNIPRSKETVTFVLLLTVSALLYATSPVIYEKLTHVLEQGFLLNRNEMYYSYDMVKKLHLILSALLIFTPIFCASLLAIYFGNIALGGNLFSIQRITPKLSNISLTGGLKKIFSTKSFPELFHALLKLFVISLIVFSVIKSSYNGLIRLSMLPLDDAMQQSAHYVLSLFLILSFSTIAFCLLDFPYQIYQNKKQMRMSKQEVKDEGKNAEPNPQARIKIKQLQRKRSRRRKMSRDIAKADVVITNPTHYAVALQYDEDTMDAPVILGMGSHLMALHIRRVCTEYKIPVLEIPLLARALYYHGEVGKRIPEGLFYAVAKVIAYIFKLDDPLMFYLEKEWIDQLPIPPEMTQQPRGSQKGK